MAQIIMTGYEDNEYRKLISEIVSESIRSEISKLIPSKEPEKTIYTRQETAELLEISLPTLHDYTKRGIIKSYRLGNKVRYKIEDILNSLSATNKC